MKTENKILRNAIAPKRDEFRRLFRFCIRRNFGSEKSKVKVVSNNLIMRSAGKIRNALRILVHNLTENQTRSRQ
jgi:hypothetical protein